MAHSKSGGGSTVEQQKIDRLASSKQAGISGSNVDGMLGGHGVSGIPQDSVLGSAALPRYGMPTITSLLPDYANAEAEFIFQAYTRAGFHGIQDLPDCLRADEVAKRRHARQEAARALMAGRGAVLEGGADVAGGARARGLFSDFEYMPSAYDAEQQLQSMQLSEGEAKRLRVAGKEFVPPGPHRGVGVKWLDGFADGVAFPYLADPYETVEDLMLQVRWQEESRQLAERFVPGGSAQRITEAPTRALQDEVMHKIWRTIEADWDGAVITMYPNANEFWIIKALVSSIDSEDGFRAYMNVFVQGNDLVRKYKLTKVVEHWNITPDDGHVYYALRPPWVVQSITDAFYTLHPEMRSFKAAVVFEEFAAGRPNHGAASSSTLRPAQQSSTSTGM